MKKGESKTYLVINKNKEIVKTYEQYQSAKKLAEDIGGAVFTNLTSLKQNDGDNPHIFDASLTRMVDFRPYNER